MRFLVFLLFSWCRPGLATKSLASLGLIKAGSKLSAFQKYTDNVVARFLKSDSAALSPAQATAMQTVKEYLKAMIWGDEGVWEWHLKDLGTSSASDCYSKLDHHHVSLFCKEENGEEKCWCNLELGNLGRRDQWGEDTIQEADSVAANGTWYAHQHSVHALTDHSGHTQNAGGWESLQTSHLKYDDNGVPYLHVCEAHNDTSGRLACEAGIVDSDGVECCAASNNADNPDPVTDGLCCREIQMTDAVENTRVGFVKQGSGQNSILAGHREGLGHGNSSTTISSNHVKLGGDDVRCQNTVGAKLANMRELRRLAELTYRRMHVCHNEKGQEFWLAGSSKGDRTVLATPNREFNSAGGWRSSTLPKEDGGGYFAAPTEVNGKYEYNSSFPPARRVAGEAAGFCGLYKNYRKQQITGSRDSLWGGKNSGDQRAENQEATGNLEINDVAYLHSFPSCARGKYINRMAGGSNRQGVRLQRDKEYSSKWTVVTAVDANGVKENSNNLWGDRRCVAWSSSERTEIAGDRNLLQFPAIAWVNADNEWEENSHQEVIVPRTCQMYNNKWINGFDNKEWVQCDTWFRDCVVALGDHSSSTGNDLNSWHGSVSVEDSAHDDNGDGIHTQNTGYHKSAGATTGWGSTEAAWASMTDAEKAGYRQKNLFYNSTHSTYAGCTQRKPLKSPLLQSCSYTANYNAYPPRKSTQEEGRGFHEFMYLEDHFVATPIVSVREDMETCLEEVRAWFDPMWTHYSLCRRGEEIGRDDFLCEHEVMEWEDAVCVYTGRQEELCGYFRTCLEEQGTACNERNIDIERRVESRKLDYESTQRIECLLDAVSYLDEGCVCYDLCDDAAQHDDTYDPNSFSDGWTTEWEGMIRINSAGDVLLNTSAEWDDAEARPLLNYTYTNVADASVLTATTDGDAFSSLSRYDVWLATRGSTVRRQVSKPTPLASGSGGVKVYKCANDEAEDTAGQCPDGLWVPTEAFDAALKGAACQKEYQAQKRAAIDRCMIDLVKCTDMDQDGDRWHDHASSIANKGFDSTEAWATVSQQQYGTTVKGTDLSSTMDLKNQSGRTWVDRTLRQPCVEGWLEDKNVATTDDAGDEVGNPPRSLGWMRSDFRFPKQFVRPSDGKVMNPTCESKYGMYACVNADWEQTTVTAVRKTPAENLQLVEQQQAQLRADHPGNVREWVVGGEVKTSTGLSTSAVHLGQIAKPSGWKATLTSSQPCGIQQDTQPSGVGVGFVAGTYSFVAGTYADGKQDDADGKSCPSRDGRIHLDTGIWHISPGCDPAPPCDYPATFCPWECPETNRCDTFRIADHPLTQTCKDVADGWCVTERNINPRFFWQVPGRKSHNTTALFCDGAADPNTLCDASFQRIYYAQLPGERGTSTFGRTQCNLETAFSMNQHYVRDHPIQTRFHSSFTHKVCKEGAEDHTYWQGVSEQTMKVFGTTSGSSESDGRQECNPRRGGPTHHDGYSGYAAHLAAWLKYPEYDENGLRDDVKRGRHCFQTDPCPHQQAVVSTVPTAADLDAYQVQITQTPGNTTGQPGVGAYLENSDGSKKRGKLVPFHKVYPFVTCPPADAQGNIIPCNSGYYIRGQTVAGSPIPAGSHSTHPILDSDGNVIAGSEGNLRPYNPAQEDDTYCEPVV